PSVPRPGRSASANRSSFCRQERSWASSSGWDLSLAPRPTLCITPSMPSSSLRLGRIGFRAGVTAATATIAYDVVQILQVLGVLHFPFDEIAIFGTSLCIVVPFVLEMLSLHYSRSAESRFWTHAGLIFTTMYA